MIAVVLAAGEGTRFFESGATVYKQVFKYKNEPLIERIVRLLDESDLFISICVVLGQNEMCNFEIKKALQNYSVTYVLNQNSREDNNFLSLFAAIEAHKNNYNGGMLVVESDCIFDQSDIHSIINASKKDEVVWANIGEKKIKQAGGLLFGIKHKNIYKIDEIKIVKNPEIDPLLLNKYKFIMKMFGLTFFSTNALKLYLVLAQNYKYEKNIYFHQPIIDNVKKFTNISVKMSPDSTSFNTLSEYNINN